MKKQNEKGDLRSHFRNQQKNNLQMIDQNEYYCFNLRNTIDQMLINFLIKRLKY